MSDFDPAFALSAKLGGAASKRAAERDSLFLLATLSNEAGESRGKARVRNLSETGLMADCEAGFSEGERLIVHLRGIGEVSACICWVRGDQIGLAFDKRIDPLAARKPPAAGTDPTPLYLRPALQVKRSR